MGFLLALALGKVKRIIRCKGILDGILEKNRVNDVEKKLIVIFSYFQN